MAEGKLPRQSKSSGTGQHKPKPTAISEPDSGRATRPRLLSEAIGRAAKAPGKEHAALLSDTRVQKAQQRTLALRVGQQQGNRNLQMMLLAKQDEPILAPRLAFLPVRTAQARCIQCKSLADEIAEDKKLMKLKPELDQELREWAAEKGRDKELDPNHPQYAFLLQEYEYQLTHGAGFDLISKPKGRKGRKAWSEKFLKAYLLARMISESGKKVEQREARAGMAAADVAEAGFVAKAFAVAQGLTDRRVKESIYEKMLIWPKKVSAQHLEAMTRFFIDQGQDLEDHAVMLKLTSSQWEYGSKLGPQKVMAVLNVMIGQYKQGPGSNDDLIAKLAKILFLYPKFRPQFSKWMWQKDPRFLFEILESKYFAEPGYDAEVPAEWYAKFSTPQQEEKARMAQIMPWVYKNKQKYYITYLIKLGKQAQVEIPEPKGTKFKAIRAWLDTYTERIGEALIKLYPDDPDKIKRVYEQIADIFFYHVERGDVDVRRFRRRFGRLRSLPPGAPKGMRMKADCDILAAYASRLLRSSGFNPEGYLAINPKPGDGHVVALLSFSGKQGSKAYYSVSNKQVTKLGAGNKEEAIVQLRDDALLVYEDDLDKYEVYYADPGKQGELPETFVNLGEAHRRKDLEPSQ